MAARGGPDPFARLVVEVLSKFTETRDRGIKRECYARYGVPEYWIIDADRRRVEVYRLQEDPDRATVVTAGLTWQPMEGGPVLELDVAELLANLE